MPNREGGYGGYRQQTPRSKNRKVNAPGSGNVRRGVTPGNMAPPSSRPAYRHDPCTPTSDGRTGPARYNAGNLDSDWVRAEDLRRSTARPAAQQGGTAPRQSSSQRGSTPPRRSTQSGAPRRRKRKPAVSRRTFFAGAAAGILLLSGIITLLLPSNSPAETVDSGEMTAPSERLVAPIPYAGTDSAGSAVNALNWGTVGPARQEETFTFTPLPAEPDAVAESGRVTTEWFADAAFLGDSITEGLSYYGINVGGALVLGYQGTSPNQIVNRVALTGEDGTEQVPLDILAERQPAKLYLLMGTNALTAEGNDEGFLAYYGRMLDELKAALPNTAIFVQSILNVRPEALEKSPGLSPTRLASINASIRAMCAEKGCYYLNLTEAFTGEDGYLTESYAQTDGIHLTVSGYSSWIDYLCTHVPYNKSNPYQAGSRWYLSDDVRQCIADLP